VNDAMEIAAVHAIAELAQAEQSEVVAAAYAGATLSFGPEYLIPKPFDHRLMEKIAPAVARAAADSGVATRPIADFEAYREKAAPVRLRLGHGDEADLRPGQGALQARGLCRGRRGARAARRAGGGRRGPGAADADRPAGGDRQQRIEKFGLRLKEGLDYDVVNVEQDERYRDFWMSYHRLTERKGVTVQVAKIEMRRRLTLIGAMLLAKGHVDGLLCGTWGTTANHLQYIDQVIGKRAAAARARRRTCSRVRLHELPDAAGAAGVPGRHARQRRPERRGTGRDHRDGGRGDAALRHHAEGRAAVAQQLRHARHAQRAEDAAHAGAAARAGALARGRRRDARRHRARRRRAPQADAQRHAQGEANLLVLPNIDAANISYNLLKTAAGGGIAIGPVLLGADKPVHILTPSATVRRIVNMTALTVADAEAGRQSGPAA
jgi:malate dehydrogenase (oxaloacetate-decarboxylating)(NADP+)